MRTTGRSLIGLSLGFVLVLQAAAVAQPEISILTPEAGTTVSKAAPNLDVSGLVAFETPEPATSRFFLRRNGCGDGEVRSLSLTSSTADNDNCRWPQWTILGTVDEEGFAEDFPAGDGVPFALDSSRPITVRLVLANEIAGAGLARVRARLSGTTTTNQLVSFGDETVEYTVTPTQATYTHTIEMAPPEGPDKQDFASLDLVVTMSGAAVNHGILRLKGASYVDMPTWSASFDRRVEVAFNSQTFNSTGVTVSEDLASWTATRSVATLPLGANTLRARARQGGSLSDVQEVAITVTS